MNELLVVAPDHSNPQIAIVTESPLSVTTPAVPTQVILVDGETVQVVTNVTEQRVVVQELAPILVVPPDSSTVETVVGFVSGPPGLRGPTGLPGPSGTEVAPINISFGDVASRAIYTLPEDMVLTGIELVISTPYDGAPTALQITLGGGGVLVDSTDIDPSQSLSFEFSPNLRLPFDTQIVFKNTPGAGCTAGAGFILLHVTEDLP